MGEFVLEHLDSPVDEHVSIIDRELNAAARYPYIYAYPPKGAYRPYFDPESVLRSWEGYAGPLSLYLHVPFCDMKCSFCTLFTTVNQPRERISRYAECLRQEFRMIAERMSGKDVVVDSIYFGGGTPSLLSPHELERLLTDIRSRLTLRESSEISLESTPDALDRAAIDQLAALGFNRMSFGVQSFDAGELTSMGRKYDADLGLSVPAAAIAAGVSNVNVDLIFGIPRQTQTDWIRHLTTAADLGVRTITVYPLVVRDRTQYARQHRMAPEDFLDEKARQEWYDLTVEALAAQGFEAHSEVTFARPGGGCRHEANEFRGLPTLGLGSGSRSYAPTLHYTDDDYSRSRPNQQVIDDYLRSVESGRPAIASAVPLDEAERRLRYVILSLLHKGTSPVEYKATFGEPLNQRFGRWFAALEACDLVEVGGDVVRLTPGGRTHSALIGGLMMSPRMRTLSKDYK